MRDRGVNATTKDPCITAKLRCLIIYLRVGSPGGGDGEVVREVGGQLQRVALELVPPLGDPQELVDDQGVKDGQRDDRADAEQDLAG